MCAASKLSDTLSPSTLVEGVMTILIAGLVLFLGIHLVPALPPLRGAAAAKWGENRYKGMFSLVSALGLVLIVAGYALSDDRTRFAPVPAARAVAPYAMVVSFILFAAANMRGHLRHAIRHPMLLGLLIWSTVHLLANGDRTGTVLFGAFALYAVVDLVSATARGAVKSFEPTAKYDVMAVVGGTVVALIVMTLHRVLFGPQVVSFGI
jgi:uncharacterized membrane protein